jgi:hypothetical protein
MILKRTVSEDYADHTGSYPTGHFRCDLWGDYKAGSKDADALFKRKIECGQSVGISWKAPRTAAQSAIYLCSAKKCRV